MRARGYKKTMERSFVKEHSGNVLDGWDCFTRRSHIRDIYDCCRPSDDNDAPVPCIIAHFDFQGWPLNTFTILLNALSPPSLPFVFQVCSPFLFLDTLRVCGSVRNAPHPSGTLAARSGSNSVVHVRFSSADLLSY